MKVSKYNTIYDDNIKRRINIAIEIFKCFILEIVLIVIILKKAD